TDRAAAEAMLGPLREWVEGEQFWMIHAAGRGDFEATVELSEGKFALFIPVGLDPERERFESVADGRAGRWHVCPGGLDRPKSLFLQPARADASLRVHFQINGEAVKEKVFVGKDRSQPKELPATVPADTAPVSPFIERPFAADREGFYVVRHRSAASRP